MTVLHWSATNGVLTFLSGKFQLYFPSFKIYYYMYIFTWLHNKVNLLYFCFLHLRTFVGHSPFVFLNHVFLQLVHHLCSPPVWRCLLWQSNSTHGYHQPLFLCCSSFYTTCHLKYICCGSCFLILVSYKNIIHGI